MDGQGFAVEEVCGATDDLELVDECPRSLFRGEVDGEDGTWQGAELLTRELIEGIILQTRMSQGLVPAIRNDV